MSSGRAESGAPSTQEVSGDADCMLASLLAAFCRPRPGHRALPMLLLLGVGWIQLQVIMCGYGAPDTSSSCSAKSHSRGEVCCPHEQLQAHREIQWCWQVAALHPAGSPSACPTREQQEVTVNASSCWNETRGDGQCPAQVQRKNLQLPSIAG